MNDVLRAIDDLKKGRFVLVHDAADREGETDLVMASRFVTKEAVRTMRTDGGGLICVTLHEDVYAKLGIPFMTDLYCAAVGKYPVLNELVPNDIPYDAKSAFSITVNHRKTFTGITDIDRALTISELGRFCAATGPMKASEARRWFGKLFRSPGHIHMLNASHGLLDTRRGHTELTTALMQMAGLPPTAAICEMMHPEGRARSRPEAIKYAKDNGLAALCCEDILAQWKRLKKEGGK
jgi:3,4-dihydroxy 2-butanone 4-phosphate synthase